MRRTLAFAAIAFALMSLPSAGAEGVISIDLKDVPLKDAIEQIFKAGGVGYSITGDLPVSHRTITIRLNNASLEEALRALSQAQPLRFENLGGEYRVELKSPSATGIDMDSLKKSWAQMFGGGVSRGISISIPAMPVVDAVDRICEVASAGGAEEKCEWDFAAGLGDSPMPGVRFNQFPSDLAVRLTLVAAGLVPSPTSGDTSVQKRGSTKLQDVLHWSPGMLLPHEAAVPGAKAGSPSISSGGVRTGGISLAGAWMMFGSGFGGGAVSIGARFEPKSRQWLYTVFASQARDAELLERLLGLSGAGYVMSEASGHAAGASLSAMAEFENSLKLAEVGRIPQSDVLKSLDVLRGKSRLVSAQLFDLTLDDALDTLVAGMDLVVTRKGPDGNPTYVIGAAPAAPAPSQKSR